MTTAPLHLRPLEQKDLAMLERHRQRHSLENGKDGDVIFDPLENTESTIEVPSTPNPREWEAQSKDVSECGWMRMWILTDENEIFGNLTLVHRPPLPTCLHRATLMMGLERATRRQGWGTKLIETAVSWSKTQPSLEWLELFVFENNPGAKSLYEKNGFEAVGTTKDRFRVYGQKIDDTHMTMKL